MSRSDGTPWNPPRSDRDEPKGPSISEILERVTVIVFMGVASGLLIALGLILAVYVIGEALL